jgi:hypothetical protein
MTAVAGLKRVSTGIRWVVADEIDCRRHVQSNCTALAKDAFTHTRDYLEIRTPSANGISITIFKKIRGRVRRQIMGTAVQTIHAGSFRDVGTGGMRRDQTL